MWGHGLRYVDVDFGSMQCRDRVLRSSVSAWAAYDRETMHGEMGVEGGGYFMVAQAEVSLVKK